MSKTILFTATILFLSLGIIPSTLAQKKKQVTSTKVKGDVKFLDDIHVQIAPNQNNTFNAKAVFPETLINEKKVIAASTSNSSVSIENANNLQLKYALLLDVQVEQALNLSLFKVIDEWFGTRYKLGGSGKDGIDCSALMQIFFTSIYGLPLPRTAREQYDFSHRISRAELKEGDLVFFNTIGGVSHVGMYLQNNKFVHASKNGVTISDLYEEYWSKHFVGAGRVDQPATALVTKP